MRKVCILYNKLSIGGQGLVAAEKLLLRLQAPEYRLVSVTDVEDYTAFFAELAKDEQLIVLGGDGTLNRFLNDTDSIRGSRSIYFAPNGSGNDFWRDINQPMDGMPICINRYMEHLPTVTVEGKTLRFFNNVAFGIDGYACAEGVRRRKPGKPANYTTAALKGLLYAFHPVNATVTVDGVTTDYSRVWLAPTMMGRYFGGGMQMAPMQMRMNTKHQVTLAVAHNMNNLRIITIFPKIFSGNHTKKKYVKYIDFLSGHHIHVVFDRPTDLQVDGEVFPAVTEYTVDYT